MTFKNISLLPHYCPLFCARPDYTDCWCWQNILILLNLRFIVYHRASSHAFIQSFIKRRDFTGFSLCSITSKRKSKTCLSWAYSMHRAVKGSGPDSDSLAVLGFEIETLTTENILSAPGLKRAEHTGRAQYGISHIIYLRTLCTICIIVCIFVGKLPSKPVVRH